ncbi:MAG: CdaR family protein [Peptococcaceae bacterium]|jgi:YbbR domain-containing protein|nr:CdaR family protein [Peptococcaceae bacterium]MDH7524729.1 CdaR family protein [Peptococcaceae bacterium]
MYHLLKKDLAYKIAAVFLAFLLWFYVTNLQNPTIDRTLTVPLSYQGLKEGLVTSERTQSIDIKIKGPRSVINPLTPKDIRALVDLSQAKLGESSFSIDLSLPPGVQLVSIKPASIQLQIDAVLERQLAIKVKTINAAAPGYSSYTPVITPSRVVVKGAQQVLESLDAAQVTIDLNQTRENLLLNLPVNLVDKNGNTVPEYSLEINPKTVQVFVPVIQNIPTKTVPIKPSLVGTPKQDWRVARVVLEPETVKITGPYERLSKIDHVLTGPIDITGIQEDLMIQVALTTPEGVSLLYEPAVKVLVQVEQGPVTRDIKGVPVTAVNVPAGSKAELKPGKIDLTIQGARKEIENLSDKDIKAMVDLADLKQDVYQLEVKIEIPSIIQVLKVDPSKVEVKIAPAN